MPQLTLEVDLNKVERTSDIFGQFNKVLLFEYSFGLVKNMGWDSFEDLMWGINLHSSVVKNSGAEGVHLIIHNISKVKELSVNDFYNLCEILVYSTINDRFHNLFHFSFEIGNDPYLTPSNIG